MRRRSVATQDHRAETMKDNGYEFFLDPSRCIGCQACVQACAECGTHRGQSMIHLEYVDRATGVQHFLFVDQKSHDMRLGWYRDEYVRTRDGWRIRRRATTFMRKHGGVDSGRQHDPLAAS